MLWVGLYRETLQTVTHQDHNAVRGRGSPAEPGEIGKLFEFFATEVGDQFLFCEKENAILLFINPDIKGCFFHRIGDQEQGPQFIQSPNLAEANLCFRCAPLIKKNFLIDTGQHQMRTFGNFSGPCLPKI
jgi:hypothetical protein